MFVVPVTLVPIGDPCWKTFSGIFVNVTENVERVCRFDHVFCKIGIYLNTRLGIINSESWIVEIKACRDSK